MPVLRISDFSGGLNTRFRQNAIQDNQTPSCRNIRLRRNGAISKRFGSSLISVTAGGGTGASFGCHAYALSGMSAEAMIVMTRENPAAVYKTTDGTSFSNVTGAFNTGESIDLTSQNSLVHFLTFKDVVRAFARYMDTRSYDNTTWSRVATANNVFPKSTHAVVHKNRIFAANVTYGGSTYRSRLKWSDYAADVWQTTNFEDIFADDGLVISGLISYGDELIVFKGPENASQSFMHSKMFRVLGDNFDASAASYVIERLALPPGVGLLGPDGMAIYRGQLIFLTNDGFYKYIGGGAAPQNISEIIREDINDLVVSAIAESDSLPAAFTFADRFYCSVRSTRDSSEGYLNRTYVLDGDAWLVDIISSNSDAFTVGDGAGSQYTKFLGNMYFTPVATTSFSGTLTGSLRRIEIDGTFTEPDQSNNSYFVNSKYTTKEYSFDRERYVISVFVYLRRQSSGTLTVGFNGDQRGEVTSSLDMSTPDSGTTENSSSSILRKQIFIGRRCRTFQLSFYNSANVDFEIHTPVEVEYK